MEAGPASLPLPPSWRLPPVLPCLVCPRPGGALHSARVCPRRPRRCSRPCLPAVPFREAPAYTNRRRRPPSSLAAPRVLLRSNSDNNLTANAPAWAAGPAQRSLSPQPLQPAPGPADAPRAVGSYVPGPRSRSPSLHRLGGAGEDGKRPLQPWPAG